jgi:hypothetical protein
MEINAVSTALQGLQQNIEKLNGAAQQITVLADAGGDAVDIAGSLVAMMTAQIGAEASIGVIKSENEMQRKVIDMFV